MNPLRLKNKWHRAYPDRRIDKSLEEHAGALGFIAWRLALETTKHLHGEGYEYASDKERIGVISEFLAFLIHVCDRLSYGQLSDEQRESFVNAMARWLSNFLQGNLEEIAGPGDYQAPFVEFLNTRLTDYAQVSFSDVEPGYDMYRYLALSILQVMGETQTNRWVVDQVIELEAPEVFTKIRTSFDNLFTSVDG